MYRMVYTKWRITIVGVHLQPGRLWGQILLGIRYLLKDDKTFGGLTGSRREEWCLGRVTAVFAADWDKKHSLKLKWPKQSTFFFIQNLKYWIGYSNQHRVKVNEKGHKLLKVSLLFCGDLSNLQMFYDYCRTY